MEKAKKIIPVLIIITCIVIAAGYLSKNHHDGLKITKVSAGVSLLDLYEQNSDLVGWIRIPDTNINYPVMSSDKYLHRDFNGKYAYRGTPFVGNTWSDSSKVSLVYGHNMWVEKTMFNPLHKYEDKYFWDTHKTAEFFVIKDKDSYPQVEKRTYEIHSVNKISIKDEIYKDVASFDDSFSTVPDLFNKANKTSLYNTGVNYQGGDCLCLCTCSYHIKGDRDSGRLLVFGTRTKTEDKDLSD